ncbi:hypothetical protein OIN60_18420 [Paenibacillus sp. P96]|uniref:DUF1292 domain-containing protein n=1 Tax=Paenibacillus zeirhizosphaerae TaxID=2987519 RepID=A0ABT9FVI0_9BACL|nr:hypothetical protein [Paenibacillus sp. P96]MDP4098710.1 hypothetical protein [Paenibacillus sp. P96]
MAELEQEVQIKQAEMKRGEDGAYLGQVIFTLEGNQSAYEVLLHSKRGKDWDYSIHFAEGPRNEEELLAVDARLEEDDDLFDLLLEAAQASLHE